MAHKSITPLGAFETAGGDAMPEHVADISGEFAEEYRTPDLALCAAASPPSASDVALDLVLTEMMQQARLASSATGTAIGLLQGSEIICRAVAGATASEVASYLQGGCKIVDACLRSGEVQRSEDTESDPRFDPAACKRLGLRSVVVVPIQDPDKKSIGVAEIFSSRPAAFSDRDVLMLEAIGRRVVHNREIAQKVVAPQATPPIQTPAVAKISKAPEIIRVRKPTLVLRAFRLPKPSWRGLQIPKFDSRLFLLLSAIILSLILGWMLGRVHGGVVRKKAAPRVSASAPKLEPQAPVQIPVAAPAPSTVSASTQTTAPISAAATSGAGPVSPEDTSTPGISISRRIVPKSKVARAAIPTSVSDDESAGSLVVFEDTPKERSSAKASQLSSVNAPEVAATVAASVSGSGATIRIPASEAEKNLIKRVEPDYPGQARAQNMQGSVVLDIIVDKTGAVHGISVIRGDPQLALAGARAVQQWRFKPWIHEGHSAQFETRVTLKVSP
jgi:TonB family protein